MSDNHLEDALVAIRRVMRATEINSLLLAKKSQLTPTQHIVLQIIANKKHATPSHISYITTLRHTTIATVINTITSGGKENTPRIQRVIWATIQGLIAIVLLVGGGSYALSAIQAGAISMALPFSFILIAATISLLRGIYIEINFPERKETVNE